MIFARKMPEFYIWRYINHLLTYLLTYLLIIARKIFFPNFRGARAPPLLSVSYILCYVMNSKIASETVMFLVCPMQYLAWDRI